MVQVNVRYTWLTLRRTLRLVCWLLLAPLQLLAWWCRRRPSMSWANRYIDPVLNALLGDAVDEDGFVGQPDFRRYYQYDDYSCSARCVLATLRHYGYKTPYGRILRELGTDGDG